MDRFGLTAKVIQSGEIVGYVVRNESGKETTMSKDKVYQLAKLGVLTSWEAVTDEDGEIHLYSDTYSLESLPNYIKNSDNSIELIGKLIKNSKQVGYVCRNSTGARKGYTNDKVWILAKQGKVDGVTAKKFNNQRVLVSDNNIFNDMQCVNMD